MVNKSQEKSIESITENLKSPCTFEVRGFPYGSCVYHTNQQVSPLLV